MSRRLTLLIVAFAPSAALAHTGAGAHGGPLLSGLLHPLLGADHLLAMVAVGLLAALAGGRALWAFPAAFLGAMLVGGLLGNAGVPLPLVEPAIVASVLLLGLAVAVAARLPLAVACAAIAGFGLAHGAAHGAEAPGTGLVAYALGFLVATAALHGAGVAAGLMARPTLLRVAGALTAVAGLALAFG